MWKNESKFVFTPCDTGKIPQLREGWHVAPKDRVVELTFHTGHKYDLFEFSFKEVRSKSLLEKETVEFLNNYVTLLNVIIYPVVGSTDWALLHALSTGDSRGDYALSVVHSLFVKYLTDEEFLKSTNNDFSKVVISFSGIMSKNKDLTANPMKFLFPDWWNWFLKFSNKTSS